MSSRFSKFIDLNGACLFNRKNELCFIDQNNSIQVNDELTENFSVYCDSLANTLRNNNDNPNLHLGIVIPGSRQRAWSSATVILNEDVVRSLYPSSGSDRYSLTQFQVNNRAKSIHRAIELLLNYQSTAQPHPGTYCPVLVDQGTTLGDYPDPGIDLDLSGDTPVLELVNFLAPVAKSKRSWEDIYPLLYYIYKNAVKTELRGKSDLTVLDHVGLGNIFPGDPGANRKTFYDAEYRHDNWLDPEESYRAGHAQNDQPAVSKELRLTVKAHELRRFSGFSHLDAYDLSLVQQESSVYLAPAGSVLLKLGSNSSNSFFLLEGTIALDCDDGISRTVESGSDSARLPIAALRPSIFGITSLTDIRFFLIDLENYSKIAEQGKARIAR